MFYKFFIGPAIIKCDKTQYEMYEVNEHTFRWLNLYSNGVQIGNIALDECTKIKYNKETSSKRVKEYFVD